MNTFLFQIRLDFDTFVITGPCTHTTSTTGWEAANSKAASQRTVCTTDTFSATNARQFPVLCGTLTGEHGKTQIDY